MCLDSLKGKLVQSSGIGYKVYMKPCNYDEPGYRLYQGPRVKIGKWLIAKTIKLNTRDFSQYISGFHIFSQLRDALRFARVKRKSGSSIIMRVKYKYAHTVGVQWNKRVIVANKMKLDKKLYEIKPNGRYPITTKL